MHDEPARREPLVVVSNRLPYNLPRVPGARHPKRNVGGLVNALEPVLADWCRTFEMIALREASGGAESEYSYEIRLYHPAEREDLLRAVRAVPGTSSVTVAIEETAEEW